MTRPPGAPTPAGPAAFHTTRWSVVLAAGGGGSAESQAALEELAGTYWYPLYAYLRRRGEPDAEARDLVQGFFALLLERGDLAAAEPGRGRFRSYLLTGLRNFAAGEWQREQTLKRGGGAQVLSLDTADAATRYGAEPTDDLSPERLYERSWARSVLERTMDGLEADYGRRGQGTLLAALKPRLAGNDDGAGLAELAEELGMTAGALKVAAHRLRQRFAVELRRQIAETVAGPEDVEDELAHLFAALAV